MKVLKAVRPADVRNTISTRAIGDVVVDAVRANALLQNRGYEEREESLCRTLSESCCRRVLRCLRGPWDWIAIARSTRP
jgi:hypothetical protein